MVVAGADLRRALHLATASLLLLLFVVSWESGRVLLVVLGGVAAAADFVRSRVPAVHFRVAAVLPVFREREARRLSGGAWLLLGYALAALFPRAPATAGILVGAVADPVAAMVGSRCTKGTARKSVAGSAAHFVASALVVGALGHGPLGALLVAAVATALERWAAPLDDNLLVAPGVAAALTLLA